MSLASVFILLSACSLAQPNLRVTEVKLGYIRDGVFVANPSRIFSAGEELAVQIELSVPAATPVHVDVKLVHPLGPVVAESHQRIEPLETPGKWTLLYTFNMSRRLPEGYYSLVVTAESGPYTSEADATFYYRGTVGLVNTMEVLYELRVEGEGELETLIVALPNDSTLKLLREVLVVPKPSLTVKDDFGNAYAVYRNIRVRGDFRVVVSFSALQGVLFVNADAPLSAPLPDEVSGFLEPSPFIESDHPEVVRLARSLTAGAATYREAIARIADYTSAALVYDEKVANLPNYKQLGALWALGAKRGACLQFARLFVALARASGIPARVVDALDVKPPGVERESYAHAYAEAYIPGYGWLPIEPQQRGSMVGLTPPAPGYVALVKGSGQRVSLPGYEGEAAMTMLVFKGSLRAALTYTASIRPAGQQPTSLELQVPLPERALFGDRLLLELPKLPGGFYEVAVHSPSSTSTFRIRPGATFELPLNETGTWLIELFAWAPGYLPAYRAAVVSVQPRPLNISLRVSGNTLFSSGEVVAVTQPPVPGAIVRFAVRTCYHREDLTATVNAEGVAVARTTPLLIPCELEVLASTEPPGYTPAAAVLKTEIKVPLALYAVVSAALAIAALIALRMRRRSRDSALPANSGSAGVRSCVRSGRVHTCPGLAEKWCISSKHC